MSNNNITPFKRYALSRESVRPANEILGVNPPKFNLKDNPQVNGYKCLVLSGDLREGTDGVFFIGAALIYPPDVDIFEISDEDRAQYAVTLITGAENVVTRLQDIKALGQFPTLGVLRNEGRAWFFD